ncbi:MAG: hypothetical protein ABEJ68_05090 [Halobacteriaceae archaeon]
MVDSRAVAALVVGVLLVLFGGIGSLVVLLGALFGVVDLTIASALFPLAFVAGAAALGYGVAALLEEGGDLRERFENADLRRLKRYVD